jgi:hypothetical protein
VLLGVPTGVISVVILSNLAVDMLYGFLIRACAMAPEPVAASAGVSMVLTDRPARRESALRILMRFCGGRGFR